MSAFKQKHGKAALALALLLSPVAGWCNRVFTDQVTGQITATPISGQIEVEHRAYKVRPGSLADKALHEFSEGQRVDIVLDAPPSDKGAQVVKITLHQAQ
jgi:hypothetical protein